MQEARTSRVVSRRGLFCSIVVLRILAIALGLMLLWVVLSATCLSDLIADQWRLPIGVVGGVIPSGDAVFVGERISGRVYKFSLDGSLVDWENTHLHPIDIKCGNGAIIVHHSGQDTPLSRDGYQISDPGSLTAEVRRDFVFHPYLVIHINGRRKDYSMQPWYFTVLQSPMPASVYPFLVLGLLSLAHKLSRITRSKHRKVDL